MQRRGLAGTLRSLRQWRAARKLTQAQLATQTGLTQAAVSQLERGVRIPILRTVERLAQALGVPCPALWQSAPAHALSRETADRIASAIIRGDQRLTSKERRLAHAIGSLAIQKLRAHRVPGSRWYARSRWAAPLRPTWVRQTYGTQITSQILQRLDALLAMRTPS